MPAVVLFFVALAVMIMESAFLGAAPIQFWALQTPLMVAIYLGLERDFVPGALILVFLLPPMEWLVGGIYGLYSVGGVVVFFLLRGLRPNLQNMWGVVRGLVAAVAALIHAAVMLAILHLIGEGGSSLASVVARQMWWSAPIVGVGAVVMGKGFARIDQLLDPGRKGTSLEI